MPYVTNLLDRATIVVAGKSIGPGQGRDIEQRQFDHWLRHHGRRWLEANPPRIAIGPAPVKVEAKPRPKPAMAAASPPAPEPAPEGPAILVDDPLATDADDQSPEPEAMGPERVSAKPRRRGKR